MARCNLMRHWKFCRLARAMDSPALARGTLELLWEAAYEAVSDYVGEPDDIAYAVSWRGAAADLVALLTECGFLDRAPDGRCLVHDLWPNAPKYVRLRWTRAHPGEVPPWQPLDPVQQRNAELPTPDPSSSVPFLSTCPSLPFPVEEHQEQAAAPRPQPVENSSAPNPKQLAALAHDLHGEEFHSSSDVKAALKTLAARRHLPYDGPSIDKALDIVSRSERPLWVTEARASPGALELHRRRRRA